MTHLGSIIKRAYTDRFALGGFNVYNLESARAVVEAANTTNKPALLMLSEKSIEYAGLDEIVTLILGLKKKSKTPIFLHLDHGRDIGLIKQAIKLGFDSVMFDGSNLPLDQNIALSIELRKAARRRGVVFEAEIGKVGGKEDFVHSHPAISKFKTDSGEALEFYRNVKCDLLAVAIGNIHGEETAAEELDFTLLSRISSLVKCPLVLHGCSNRSSSEYRVAIAEGVVKINIDTELKQAFVRGASRAIKKRISDPREILALAGREMASNVKEKIAIFSAGANQKN